MSTSQQKSPRINTALNRQLQPLHLIITGGTIDSYIDRAGETKTSFKSCVKGYLEDMVVPYFPIRETVVALKDSREITDETRKEVYEAIMASSCKLFLITHGTFTMTETADYLQEKAESLTGRTIVLTGSFYPLRHFTSSDASFNLGYALGALHHLPEGIYMTMQGRTFLPGQVRKNVKHSRFEPI